MTLDFFVNNYDINDFKIKKADIKDNKLYLDINYDIYLELIANGYRPEMDMNVNKTFIFNVKNLSNHKFKKPYNISNIEYNNFVLSFIINDIKLEIVDEIEVK